MRRPAHCCRWVSKVLGGPRWSEQRVTGTRRSVWVERKAGQRTNFVQPLVAGDLVLAAAEDLRCIFDEARQDQHNSSWSGRRVMTRVFTGMLTMFPGGVDCMRMVGASPSLQRVYASGTGWIQTQKYNPTPLTVWRPGLNAFVVAGHVLALWSLQTLVVGQSLLVCARQHAVVAERHDRRRGGSHASRCVEQDEMFNRSTLFARYERRRRRFSKTHGLHTAICDTQGVERWSIGHLCRGCCDCDAQRGGPDDD